MDLTTKPDHLATPADIKAAEAVLSLSQHERQTVSESVEAYLISLCSDNELEAGIDRLCDLYWKATIPETPFKHSEIDVFAIGALRALKAHSDHQTALELTDHLRRARRSSRNEPFHITSILHTVGVDIDS